ncbi:MAG TPA: hypothetical protein VMY37_00410 [Thermoguttaceae bacterium]|nr:hypothetical protein [Thermoguttaceae bacterium]
MAAFFSRLGPACTVLLCLWTQGRPAEPTLPVGRASEPSMFSHFPDSMHAVVWRNWHAVEPARIAEVLGTSVENVTAVADSMGLPPAVPIPREQNSPGHFHMTLLRRNWHLLPCEQLAVLLGVSPDELVAFVRGEDVANWSILGGFKPACEPVRYAPPDAAARRRAAAIRQLVEQHFGDEIRKPGEPRFAFIRRLSRARGLGPVDDGPEKPLFAPRYVCSCFQVLGDPLMDPELDVYPEGLLERLAEVGVDGVWLYGELAKLAPGGEEFPEFGVDHETRLANLRRLVARCKRFGIGVYLYINEPRAMPVAFFENRPEMAGVRRGDRICLCTSNPTVRRWMADAMAHVFRSAPGLAGVFTITASENQTNCAWAGAQRQRECPRCKDRDYAEIIAEVNATIASGVHRVAPDAKVIAWDWGWHGHRDAPDVIAKLPDSVWLKSVSEWAMPIERGGVKTAVGEYAISAVGPGPRALRHWQWAKKAGLKTIAKVQLNNTWELSSVPYLPVMDLVAEHCHRLASVGVDGMMLGWTLGGYPSPNLEVAHRFNRTPPPSVDEVLDAVARDRFGPDAAPHARKAWTALSRAFTEYPYHIAVVYTAPVQTGPANLLYPTRTGWAATMVGFPYDAVDQWRGPYPRDVFAEQFEKVAAGWGQGVAELETAVEKTPVEKRPAVQTELIYARAARLHFASVANQTRFIMARDALADEADPLSPAERRRRIDEIQRIAESEIALARELYGLTRLDSMLGFETFCQYFYLPLDLVEKVVNCQHVLDRYGAEPQAVQ